MDLTEIGLFVATLCSEQLIDPLDCRKEKPVQLIFIRKGIKMSFFY